MKTLVLVTHNRRKIDEAGDIARKYSIELVMPKDKTEKLEIQADSIEEVARFSAVEAFKKIKQPLVVEDSGLFIDALKDFPGVYSAHVFVTLGNKGILKLMDKVENRKAYFDCCVCFYDGKTLKSFRERVDGVIINEERGDLGFGFDPIFVPNDYGGKSYGEVNIELKNRTSHRGKAFDSFFRWYSNEK